MAAALRADCARFGSEVNGTLYGTASGNGGITNDGTVYKVKLAP